MLALEMDFCEKQQKIVVNVRENEGVNDWP